MAPEADSSPAVPGIEDATLERLARRELAIQATDLIGEVLGVDVTVSLLMRLSRATETSDVRLSARRALRCVEAIGRTDSPVVKAVGPSELYHYVEAVITYGAGERTFLQLIEDRRLRAHEVTGLYSLRSLIAAETDGSKPGFPTLLRALDSLGLSPDEACSDPDATLARLDEAGFIVTHAGSRVFDRPIFAPDFSQRRVPLGRDIDSDRRPDDSTEWLRVAFGEEGFLDETED